MTNEKDLTKMTPDTERAINAIKPLCDALRIEVTADNARLYMNGQAIGISSNSTWATLMEAIGYIFLECYEREFRRGTLDARNVKDNIKRYWLTEYQIKAVKLAEENLRLKKKLEEMGVEAWNCTGRG